MLLVKYGTNMRIVFICRRYAPGEAWTNRLLAYAKGFLLQNVDVCILFLIPDKNRIPYEIKIPGLRVVNLWETDGFLIRSHRMFSYLRNSCRIGSYLRDGDVCFLMDASGLFIENIRWSGKKVKIVCEVTEHPLVLLRGKLWRVGRWISKFKKIDKLFVISHSLREYFVNQGIPADAVQVINMFVDISRFDNVKKQTHRRYIAYCGNISNYKDGVDILVEAFSIFHNYYPYYTLEIYGRSVGDTVDELKKLILMNGLEEHVIFTGMISAEEMPQKLVDATVLALSRPENLQSINGFPTKLGEYLMSGNPVVVTSVGEIPNFLKDGYNAYLAIPGSAIDFANKLLTAVSEIDTHPEIPLRAKELAMNEFSYIEQTRRALFYICN